MNNITDRLTNIHALFFYQGRIYIERARAAGVAGRDERRVRETKERGEMRAAEDLDHDDGQ